MLYLHSHRKLLRLSRIVHSIWQFDRAEVVEVLVEEVEVVFLEILQVILSLNPTKECSEGMLRKRFRMLVVDLHCLVEGLFCVGGDLQSSIEELL